MRKKPENNRIIETRVITYSFYEIGNKTAIINSVYKNENAPNLNNSLLKLMQSDVDETDLQ